eukprot:symbB.v1.2.018327.t1/scaffold1417.1/size119926/1
MVDAYSDSSSDIDHPHEGGSFSEFSFLSQERPGGYPEAVSEAGSPCSPLAVEASETFNAVGGNGESAGLGDADASAEAQELATEALVEVLEVINAQEVPAIDFDTNLAILAAMDSPSSSESPSKRWAKVEVGEDDQDDPCTPHGKLFELVEDELPDVAEEVRKQLKESLTMPEDISKDSGSTNEVNHVELPKADKLASATQKGPTSGGPVASIKKEIVDSKECKRIETREDQAKAAPLKAGAPLVTEEVLRVRTQSLSAWENWNGLVAPDLRFEPDILRGLRSIRSEPTFLVDHRIQQQQIERGQRWMLEARHKRAPKAAPEKPKAAAEVLKARLPRPEWMQSQPQSPESPDSPSDAWAPEQLHHSWAPELRRSWSEVSGGGSLRSGRQRRSIEMAEAARLAIARSNSFSRNFSPDNAPIGPSCVAAPKDGSILVRKTQRRVSFNSHDLDAIKPGSLEEVKVKHDDAVPPASPEFGLADASESTGEGRRSSPPVLTQIHVSAPDPEKSSSCAEESVAAEMAAGEAATKAEKKRKKTKEEELQEIEDFIWEATEKAALAQRDAADEATMDLANSMLNMAEDMERVKQLASREGHREADSQSISEQMDSNLKPSKLPILGNLEPKAKLEEEHRRREEEARLEEEHRRREEEARLEEEHRRREEEARLEEEHRRREEEARLEEEHRRSEEEAKLEEERRKWEEARLEQQRSRHQVQLEEECRRHQAELEEERRRHQAQLEEERIRHKAEKDAYCAVLSN